MKCVGEESENLAALGALVGGISLLIAMKELGPKYWDKELSDVLTPVSLLVFWAVSGLLAWHGKNRDGGDMGRVLDFVVGVGMFPVGVAAGSLLPEVFEYHARVAFGFVVGVCYGFTFYWRVENLKKLSGNVQSESYQSVNSETACQDRRSCKPDGAESRNAGRQSSESPDLRLEENLSDRGQASDNLVVIRGCLAWYGKVLGAFLVLPLVVLYVPYFFANAIFGEAVANFVLTIVGLVGIIFVLWVITIAGGGGEYGDPD